MKPKFRVWDKVNKRFFSQELLDNLTVNVFLNSEFIQQFTGLLDKHGEDICEGDILKIPGFNGPMEVMFGEYYNPVNENRGVGFFAFSKGQRSWALCGPQKLEIVGNIFENKELLNK